MSQGKNNLITALDFEPSFLESISSAKGAVKGISNGYTVKLSDNGARLVYNSNSDGIITIPATLPNGFLIHIVATGPGLVRVSGVSLIDSTGSTVPSGEGIKESTVIKSNGAWYKGLDASDFRDLAARIASLESLSAVTFFLSNSELTPSIQVGGVVGQIVVNNLASPMITLSGPDADKFSINGATRELVLAKAILPGAVAQVNIEVRGEVGGPIVAVSPIQIRRPFVKPLAPANLRTQNVTSKTVIIRWDEVNQPGDEYQYSLNGGTSWTKIGTNATSYPLMDLSPGQTYDIMVRAVNPSFTGNPASVSVTLLAEVTGDVYYVSSSGSNSNSGSQSQPLSSLSGVLAKNPKPGDQVLFKRGDIFTFEFNLNGKKGNASAPLVFGAYGTGNQPTFRTPGRFGEIIRSHYIIVRDLRYEAGSNDSGLLIKGDSRYVTAENLTIVGASDYTCEKGITYSSYNGDDKSQCTYTVVRNCKISRFAESVYSGAGMKEGGLIEGNHIFDLPNKNQDSSSDGIRAHGGNPQDGNRLDDYNGLIIRNNLIEEWGDDAVDLFNGSNVIVERNTCRNPKVGAANALKIGGDPNTGNHEVSPFPSRNNIARYNKVYNLNGNMAAIDTNGCRAARVYGNLVYDVPRGIMVSSKSQDCEIHNNTVFAEKDAFYAGVSTSGVVAATLKNNIFSSVSGQEVNNGEGSTQVIGNSNLLIRGKIRGNYTSQNDIKGSVSNPVNVGFVNAGADNYELTSGSVAINAGVPVAGYIEDLKKHNIIGSVDIGCYEYNPDGTSGGGGSNPPADPGNLPNIKLFAIGGSTTKNYAPFLGWADVIDDFFISKVTVVNEAEPGRSTQTTRERGAWDAVINASSPGDFVFMAFGHNERSAGITTPANAPYNGPFVDAIKAFNSEAKAVGMKPVNMSPVSRHQVNRTNGPSSTPEQYNLRNLLAGEENNADHLGDYVGSTQQAASESNVAYLALNPAIRQVWLDNWANGYPTESKVQRYFPNYRTTAPDDYRTGYQPGADSTHIGLAGARKVAETIISLINASNHPDAQVLAQYVRSEYRNL